jgi:hypothetical protein
MKNRIFQPAQSLMAASRKGMARNADKNNPFAGLHATAGFFKPIYSKAQKRLLEPDLLPIDEAAEKTGVAPETYREMADNGEAVLIVLEGYEVVPACMFDRNGRQDALMLDLAREFANAEHGHSHFRFIDFVDFMAQTVEIPVPVSAKNLTAIFAKTGLSGYPHAASASATLTMRQLADEREAHPGFLEKLAKCAHNFLTRTGQDGSSGGLSRPFLDKYKLPWKTHDEQMQDDYRAQQERRQQLG